MVIRLVVGLSLLKPHTKHKTLTNSITQKTKTHFHSTSLLSTNETRQKTTTLFLSTQRLTPDSTQGVPKKAEDFLHLLCTYSSACVVGFTRLYV